MRTHSRPSGACTLPLALLLTIGILPLDMSPVEAAGFKFRVRSPIRVHYGRGFSSSSSRGSSSTQPADKQDDKARPRPPGTAAAAEARARAALQAERAQHDGPTIYQPIPIGKTTEYSGGITCVAGC